MRIDDKIAWLAVHIARWPDFQVDLWMRDGQLIAEERGSWDYKDHGSRGYLGCVQKMGQDCYQVAASIRDMVHQHYRDAKPVRSIWDIAA